MKRILWVLAACTLSLGAYSQDKPKKKVLFYTSMGHREDVWTNPMFQSLLVGGIHWAVGNLEADVTPNVEKTTPGFRTIPPEK
ncbi:MAG TPA: hypothetical protein VJB14_06410 [Planctomycetota bacterium]|nr:hypothetical protein [Planctomycetota bacterium]